MAIPRALVQGLVLLTHFSCTTCTLSPLVFGQSAPLTGAHGHLGRDIQRGLLAAFGQADRPVTLITYDDSSGLDATRNNTLRLVLEDNVTAVIGAVGEKAASVVAEVAGGRGVPSFPMTGTRSLRMPFMERVLHLRTSLLDEVAAALEYLIHQNIDRIALVYPDDKEELYQDVVSILGAQQMTVLSHHSYSKGEDADDRFQIALETIERLDRVGLQHEAVLVCGETPPALQLTQAIVSWTNTPLAIVFAGVLDPEHIAKQLAAASLHQWVTFTVGIASAPMANRQSGYGLLLGAAYYDALHDHDGDGNQTVAVYEGYLLGRFILEAIDREPLAATIADAFYNQAVLRVLDLRMGPFGSYCHQVAVGCQCNQGGRSVAHASVLDNGQLWALNETFSFHSCGFRVEGIAPVRIGHVVPLSGPMAGVGVSLHRGLLAAFLEARKTGELGSTAVELLAYDDLGNTSVAEEETRHLIEDHHAIAIVAPVGDEVSEAVVAKAISLDTPVIAPLSGATSLRTPFEREIIHLRPSTLQETSVLLEAMCGDVADGIQSECSFSSFFMIVFNNSHGHEAHHGVVNGLHERGLKLQRVRWLTESSLSQLSACQLGVSQWSDLAPEVIIMVGRSYFLPTLASCLSATFSGVRVAAIPEAGLGTEVTGQEDFLRQWPSEGIYVAHVTPTRSAITTQFYQAMSLSSQEEYGAGSAFDHMAFEGYIIGRMILTVVRQLWPVTKESFLQSFYAMRSLHLAVDFIVGPYIDQDIAASSNATLECSRGVSELHLSSINRNGTLIPLSPAQRTWPTSSRCGEVPYSCISGYYRDLVEKVCRFCDIGNEIINVSGSTACLPCQPGTVGVLPGKCKNCSVGRYANATGDASGECSLCAPGTAAEKPGMTACDECAVGTMQAMWGRTFCENCLPGTVSKEIGSSACTDCIQGRASAAEGSSRCEECEPGTITDELGQTRCQRCSVGQFVRNPGKSACKLCTIGTYADDLGRTECEICPGDYNTSSRGASSSRECMCPAGTYEALGGDDDDPPVCVSCPSGMTCDWGSREANLYNDSFNSGTIPEAEAGYMTLAAEPLRAFRCREEEACPGGAPGTCKPNFAIVVACGECEHGHYKGQADMSCLVCGAGDWVPSVMACISVTALVILTTHAVNRSMVLRSHSSMSALVVMGMVMRSYQLLSIYTVLELEWYEPVASFIRAVSLMSFDISLVRLKCIFPAVTPAVRYGIVQLVGPYGFAAMLVVVLLRKKLGVSHHGYMLEVSNSGGTFIHMFFLSITLSSLMPFMCYPHPDRRGSSMVALPAILCYSSSEHHSIIVLGVASFLFFTLPMLISAFLVALLYPRYVQDIAMTGSKRLSHFRVLYVKYRPEAYYYEVILLTRSLALVLVPVVHDDKAAQVLLLVGVIVFFILVQQQINPWRTPWVNLLDGIACSLFILIIVSGVLTLDLSLDEDTVKVLNNMSLLTLILLMMGGFGASLYARCMPGPTYQYFICHHKRDAQAQARFLKMLLSGSTRLKVFIDSDDLEELDGLFDIVKKQVRKLVVYLTRDTLTRPWCAGEIATAWGHKVSTTAVWTPGFEMLADEELKNTEAYLDASGMALKSYGISFEDVEAAFRRLLSEEQTPTLYLRKWRSSKRFDVLAKELLLSNGQATISRLTSEDHDDLEDLKVAERKSDMLIFSVEPRNDEACAAVGILLLKIKERLEDSVKRQICRLDDCRDSSSDEFFAVTRAYAVVVFLSSGTLSCWAQLRVITRVMRMVNFPTEHHMGRPQDAIVRAPPKVVPVYIPDFTFPSAEDMLKIVSRFWPDDFEDGKVKLLEGFFRNIAIFFATNAADNVLVAQASQVASRLQERKKFGQNTPPPVLAATSSGRSKVLDAVEQTLSTRSQRNSGSNSATDFTRVNSHQSSRLMTMVASFRSDRGSEEKSDASGNGSTGMTAVPPVEPRDSFEETPSDASPEQHPHKSGMSEPNKLEEISEDLSQLGDVAAERPIMFDLEDIRDVLSQCDGVADERFIPDLPQGLLRL